VTLENAKVLSIRNIDFLGYVVEFDSSELANVIPCEPHPDLLFAVNDTFMECTDCYLKNMYYLNMTVAVEMMNILDIEQ
jgi:hypothetical protein